MCGIAGELRFDDRPADAEALARITADMAPRGPHGHGLHVAGPVGLGHRRLKVIDLSECGAQPMVDPELGLSLVFNGCIYNHRALREELHALGYRFFSGSDTEVVLKAFHHWGPDCVRRFHGMFAFAVHSRDDGSLTLARDRLGIKPLYLTRDAHRLRFASTLPALLAGGGVDTSPDPVALHHYLSFHAVVPPPLTVLAGVRKLPQATVRVIRRDGRETDTCYWRPEHVRRPEFEGLDAADWAAILREKLRTAVRRRTVSDVPVGVLLSGGLDSSVIVALLAEHGVPNLRTFSVGFPPAGGEQGDEFAYSDLVAREFGTVHHRIMIDPARLLPAVDATIAAMSEPMTSHDCVAFHLLSEDVSPHVRVVQSGQGADEVLAGYNWYPPLAHTPRSEAAQAYANVFCDRPHATMADILEPEHLLDHDPSRTLIAEHMGRPGAATAVDAALRLDTGVMLVDDPVKRVDNMTMAWGVEARTPFLDHELVETMAACPPELQLANGGKGVLKDAARGLVPDAVIDRRKGYFPVPAIRHLDGGLLERVREAVTDPRARKRGLVRDDWVDRMLRDPNAHRTTFGANALWQVAVLEMWLQERGL
ncbi:N-acetylglutaminylglutamine amidotransferase [Pseudonocardia phyllosphaerae]|uniref:N-acetylglutaminylglutamine amidotransferase n=1 Tax=Pseudonocardia phyllosphaerae TaxID=3390502 RepID=UPI00397CF989